MENPVGVDLIGNYADAFLTSVLRRYPAGSAAVAGQIKRRRNVSVMTGMRKRKSLSLTQRSAGAARPPPTAWDLQSSHTAAAAAAATVAATVAAAAAGYISVTVSHFSK